MFFQSRQAETASTLSGLLSRLAGKQHGKYRFSISSIADGSANDVNVS
jgi:hypothetical protein